MARGLQVLPAAPIGRQGHALHLAVSGSSLGRSTQSTISIRGASPWHAVPRTARSGAHLPRGPPPIGMRAEYRTGRADAVFVGWRRQTRVDDPSKEETDMSGRSIAGIGMPSLMALQ